MKKLLFAPILAAMMLFFCGCISTNDKLPSEDIEVLDKHRDIIAILRSPRIPPNSEAKYNAAKALIKHVDLYFTRETQTVDKLFYHRDAMVDAPGSDNPVFTFTYMHENKILRIRFFTYKKFITRVEITEK